MKYDYASVPGCQWKLRSYVQSSLSCLHNLLCDLYITQIEFLCPFGECFVKSLLYMLRCTVFLSDGHNNFNNFSKRNLIQENTTWNTSGNDKVMYIIYTKIKRVC